MNKITQDFSKAELKQLATCLKEDVKSKWISDCRKYFLLKIERLLNNKVLTPQKE